MTTKKLPLQLMLIAATSLIAVTANAQTAEQNVNVAAMELSSRREK